MKLSGGAEAQGTPEELFERLLDPALLSRCIPGCEQIEELEPGVYRTVVAAGVGGMKRRFEGRVTVSDVVRPTSYRLTISGESPVGHVTGEARIRLAPVGTATRVSYDGEAKVAGMMAAFGGRLLEGAANKAVAGFFERLVREVAS